MRQDKREDGQCILLLGTSRQRTMKTIAIAIASQFLILALVACFVWSADIWTGVSLMYPAYIIIALLTCGLLLLPGTLARRPEVLVIPGLWLAFLLALPFVANSSLKPLLWGVRDLEQGMSRDAVLETLKSHYTGTSFPEPTLYSEEQGDAWGQPTTTRLCFKPGGRSPELQAECLMLFLEDGRFTRASFLAD